MLKSAQTVVLAFLWRMARKPDGKITRAATSLEASVEDFTERLKHAPALPEVSSNPEGLIELNESLISDIKIVIEEIKSFKTTFDGMKETLKATAAAMMSQHVEQVRQGNRRSNGERAQLLKGEPQKTQMCMPCSAYLATLSLMAYTEHWQPTPSKGPAVRRQTEKVWHHRA